MGTVHPESPPSPPPPDPHGAEVALGPLALALGQQLLVYTPDGPVGGTFTCTQCRVQAWQPELLAHAATCPYRLAAAPPARW